MFGNPQQLGAWFEIGLIVGAFVSGALIAWFPKLKFSKSKKKHHSLGKRFETLHTRIHEELTTLRIQCNSARTWCASFHNGESFFDGTPIRKWSITHESVHHGSRDSVEETQSILASRFPEMIQLLQDNSVSLQVVGSLPDTHSMKSYMQSRNVTGFMMLPILDTKGIELYGFICVEWSSLSHLDKIDAEREWEVIMALKESRNIIQGLQINKG